MGASGQAVPQQEADGGADDEQDEAAQGAGPVGPLVIEINEGGHDAKQDEDLIQVADGDVARVRAEQVGLAPARQQAR